MLGASPGFFSKNRTRLQLALAVVLLAVTFTRLATIFQRGVFIDYLAYCDTTQAILSGLDPYDLQNLRYHDWPEAPIVYPGYVPFFQALAKEPHRFQLPYLLASIVAALGALTLLLRRTCLPDGIAPLKNPSGFLIYSVVIFSFFNASPVLAALRQGQSAMLVFVAIAMMLLIRHTASRAVLLGTAAVMKYSLLTVWGPLLFFKKHYRLCLYGLLFFLAAGLYPAIYYPDLVGLMKSYLHEISQTTSEGFNAYGVSGYNMVHLDFIRSGLVAVALKIALIFGGVALFLREKGTPEISLHLFFAAGCLTMLISYHRVYDVVVLLPFLSLISYELIEKRKYRLLTLCLLFQLYFLVPENIVFSIADLLGRRFPLLDQWIYLGHFDRWSHLVPLHAIAMLLLTLFAYYLTVSQTSLYRFRLASGQVAAESTATPRPKSDPAPPAGLGQR